MDYWPQDGSDGHPPAQYIARYASGDRVKDRITSVWLTISKSLKSAILEIVDDLSPAAAK
jgi:hypothetical protein